MTRNDRWYERLAWRFLARFRLSLVAICRESSRLSRPNADYHDWPDGDIGWPANFAVHTCTRCGKEFTI